MFVLYTPMTNGYLAPGGRIVFNTRPARKFTQEARAKHAAKKINKELDFTGDFAFVPMKLENALDRRDRL